MYKCYTEKKFFPEIIAIYIFCIGIPYVTFLALLNIFVLTLKLSM